MYYLIGYPGFQYNQVEKDSFIWREKEVSLKVDMAEASREVSAFSETKIAEMGSLLQKIVDEKRLLETKLEEASREPGNWVQMMHSNY